jgi:hypothetical protein
VGISRLVDYGMPFHMRWDGLSSDATAVAKLCRLKGTRRADGEAIGGANDRVIFGHTQG